MLPGAALEQPRARPKGGRVTETARTAPAAGEPQRVAPHTLFVPAFGNVAVLETGDGLLMVDASGRPAGAETWVWAPQRRVLCTGDLWISCVPDCGDPLRVQRYAEGWADALDAMAALGAELLLPGHGPAIIGAGEIRTALTDVSGYLRS